jgi:hypothetical protein
MNYYDSTVYYPPKTRVTPRSPVCHKENSVAETLGVSGRHMDKVVAVPLAPGT